MFKTPFAKMNQRATELQQKFQRLLDEVAAGARSSNDKVVQDATAFMQEEMGGLKAVTDGATNAYGLGIKIAQEPRAQITGIRLELASIWKRAAERAA